MTNKHLPIAIAVFVLILVVLACGPGTGGEAPSVTITSPASGTTVTLGEEVQILSTAAADGGVARVDLLVNGQVVRSDTPPSGTPPTFSVVQAWTPAIAGEVTVSVIAYDTEGNASDPAAITIRVEEAVAQITPTPVPDVEGEGGCQLNAAYVADLTVPDDTQMSPGESFVKTWRLRNSGTCDWGPGFRLVFVGGDQMGAPASVDVPPTAAGSTVDINVPMQAPSSPGTYRGDWRMQSDTGLAFGSRIYVQIVVPSPVTETPTEGPTETPTEGPTEPSPAPPTNLTANIDGSMHLMLTWNDAVGEDHYEYTISWVAGGMGSAYADTLPADTTSYDGGTLSCGGQGSFTIIAIADDGTEIGRDSVDYSTAPCPPQVWSHDVGAFASRARYYIRLTGPGQVHVRAEWSGGNTLALILNGPGQVGYYAREDGNSPLELTYNVSSGDFGSGDTWVLSIVDFGGGTAQGTVEITYPSGSTVSPFVDDFYLSDGSGAAINVIVLKNPGTIEAEATWSGSPSSMALIINGPGQVGYYAREDGSSPLSVSYEVTLDDWLSGDTWRVSWKAFSSPNAEGNITITYP